MHINVQKIKNKQMKLSEEEEEKLLVLKYCQRHLISLELIGFSSKDNSLLITNLGAQVLKLIGLNVESENFAKSISTLDLSHNLVKKTQEIQDNIAKTRDDAIKAIEQNNFNQPPQFIPLRINLGKG